MTSNVRRSTSMLINDSARFDNGKNVEEQSDLLPFKLVGDQVRLQQVLINLTKNALKFTRKGRITLYIAYDYSQEQLQVHVEDTGKGIAKDELNKLFTLFGKLERTEELNPDGLGMGLTISQKIIHNCGGQIDVFSDGVNKGSTFMFQMPMQMPEEAAKLAI